MNMDREDQCQFVAMSTLSVIFMRGLDEQTWRRSVPDPPPVVGRCEIDGTDPLLNISHRSLSLRDVQFSADEWAGFQFFFLNWFHKTRP